MSFYPMYIPLYGGGGHGGRGAPNSKGLLVAIGICVVFYSGVHYYIETPRFKMLMKWQNPPQKTQINVNIKHENNFPHIVALEHIGLDCMKKKGYNIVSDYKGSFYTRTLSLSYDEVMKAIITKKDKSQELIDKKEFFHDCNECGVTTEFQYQHKDKYYKKTYKWYTCSIPELK